MRIRIVLYPDIDTPPTLSYNYQYSIASAFYDLLRGTDYDDLHNKRSPKFFSFSRLFLDVIKTKRAGIEVQGAATLWFSTPNESLLKTMIGSLNETNKLSIDGIPFRILSVSEPYQYANSRGEDTLISMAPVLLRTVIEEEGELKQWEIGPADGRFNDLLAEKMRRRYQEFTDKSGDLEVITSWDSKKKMIKVVDVWHRAYYLKTRIRGDPEVLSFVYDCGLGDKTSMGFGMVRSPFDDIPVHTAEHLKGVVK